MNEIIDRVIERRASSVLRMRSHSRVRRVTVDSNSIARWQSPGGIQASK